MPAHAAQVAPKLPTSHMNKTKKQKKFALTPVDTLIGDWNASYQFLGNSKSTLYFLTDADAPRSRVVAINLDQPDKAHWKEVVAENKDTLQNARIVDHKIIATYLHDAHSAVRLFDEKGKSLGEIALPGLGTASGFSGRTRDAETFYTFSSYTTPPAVYRYDLSLFSSNAWRAPKTGFDSSRYETCQVFYSSRDGTRIPMFITAKKGLALNGASPTILYGYGGFNSAVQPTFSAPIAEWLDLGGVYAVANLRGGGEYGRDWHEAGIKTHKQNVFDDFIAAAEYLIKEKYTSPSKLAIRGGLEWRPASRGNGVAASRAVCRSDPAGRRARYAALPRLHDWQSLGI